MRKLAYITPTVAILATAVATAATTTTATVTVKPNLPKKGSEIIVNAGPFPASTSLPKSLTLTLQRGFTSATAKKSSATYRPGWADSVPELCDQSAAQNDSCPADTKIGRGTGTIALSGVPLASGSIPFNLTMFAVKPHAGTCPMSILLEFQAGTTVSGLLGQQSGGTIGELCRKDGGLEATFNNLPNFGVTTLPGGATATLSNITFSAGASHLVKTKKKVKRNGKTVTVTKKTRYYLLNNPSKCPASKTWTGSFAIGLSNGTTTVPFTTACRSK